MASKDTGYKGVLQSITGLTNLPGTGLIVDRGDATVTAVVSGPLVPANEKRVWLLVTNYGDYRCCLNLGTNAGNALWLWPGDSCMFDKDHPWSGSVQWSGDAIGTSVTWLEASLAAVRYK